MSFTAAESGHAPVRRPPSIRAALELFSSMRFAIALLALICIASVTGTVVKQNEPLNNYVNQFGPFWADVFEKFGLYNVYSAAWFLLILAFLVLSTSLCIARNTPKVLADLKTYKEDLREASLQAFHHKGRGVLARDGAAALAHVLTVLARHGWQARAQVRAGGTMVAARKGRANKIGYLTAHSAIVLICLGGLFDGDLIVKAQMLLTGKTSYQGGGLIKDVGEQHRLSARNPAFRGNLFVPEGASANTAVLSMPDGVVLQELPFEVELKKFSVDYYDTGMPKLFASDIVIHDRASGQSTPARVEVNKPAQYGGIQIYQSSFDDGGSLVKLKATPMHAGVGGFDVQGHVGENATLTNGTDQVTLEFTGLKTINVENLGRDGPDSPNGAGPTDVRGVDLGGTLERHLGSGANPKNKVKNLRNVGPAVTYKLRDASGQAREFHNYMLPMTIEGRRVFLAGVREGTGDDLRYLRLPADENDTLDGWLRLRAALDDAALRQSAASRYAALAAPEGRPELIGPLRTTALRTLELFAGAQKPPHTAANEPAGGLVALSQFIETTVPEADRERVAQPLLRILDGAIFELNQLARERAGLQTLQPDATSQSFISQSILALSDAMFYPAPFMLQLTGFDLVQASVLQVTRAPGQKLVYLGAVLLMLGVVAMLYTRERRLWVWLAPSTAGADVASTSATLALSTPRRTLDVDAEFERLRSELLDAPPPTAAAAAAATAAATPSSGEPHP